MPDIARATDDMQTQIARADSKASLLLALNGALLAVVATIVVEGPELPVTARIIGTLALTALGAAALLLLLAVRPRGGVFTTTSLLQDQDQEEELTRLCRIATSKYRRIRQAVDAILTGGALLATAAALAVLS